MSLIRRAQEAAGAARSKVEGAASAASRTASASSPQELINKTLAGASQRARAAVGMGRRGLTTVIEAIDPRTLADLIVRATWLQETTNAALREKGSPYRIAELSITASIPPGVTFTIGRIGQPMETVQGEVHPSEELIKHDPLAGEIVIALDGAMLDESQVAAFVDAVTLPGETPPSPESRR